mgnify:CR=1 FL=1
MVPARPLCAIALLPLLASCLTAQPRPAGPDDVRAVSAFNALDRYVACERAASPGDFVAIGPDDRLVAFDLHGDGARYLSVIGSRNGRDAIDVVSWLTGRAHILRRGAGTPAPVADASCTARFLRSPDLGKAIERLDPATLEATSVENAFGNVTVLTFTTLGRTRTCLYFHQEARSADSARSTPPVVLSASGLDCRNSHDGIRGELMRELLPVLRSVRATPS